MVNMRISTYIPLTMQFLKLIFQFGCCTEVTAWTHSQCLSWPLCLCQHNSHLVGLTLLSVRTYVLILSKSNCSTSAQLYLLFRTEATRRQSCALRSHRTIFRVHKPRRLTRVASVKWCKQVSLSLSTSKLYAASVVKHLHSSSF